MELYWLARMMDCLPLPPLWSIKPGSSYKEYIYEPNDLIFEIHPSYIYIMEQMNRFRSNFNKMDPLQQNYYSNMRQMVFFDYFERSYMVDIYGTYNRMEAESRNKNNSKKTKKFLRDGGVGNLITSDWMILEGIHNSEIKDLAYPLIFKI